MVAIDTESFLTQETLHPNQNRGTVTFSINDKIIHMKITKEEDEQLIPIPLNREKLKIMLQYALRFGLELPPPSTREKARCIDHLLYCPYHKRI